MTVSCRPDQPGSDQSSTERGTARDVPWYLGAVVLLVIVLSVYWQVGGDAFLNFDDDVYVSENPVVLRGLTREGVSWAFTTFHAANWHPLTWLSHMLDVELFGPSAGWHHRMNVLYHLLNTELLFLVLWGMTGGVLRSAFAAALFGIHPLHVESVAWIAERKDVLSTLFWISAMGAYLRYARRPGVGRYLPVAVLLALGLMCKPMLVTLPLVLLLMDWWPLGRMVPPDSPGSPPWRISVPALRRLAWEKVPLLGLAAISSVVTYLAQARAGAVQPTGFLPFGSRLSNALVSYAMYLVKTAWPASLAVYYPHPASVHGGVPAWKIAGAILLLAGISVTVLRLAGRRPYLAVGWLWYLGTLFPVIGLVQVGMQAMADRYTYVPLIGVFIAVAWVIPVAAAGRVRKVALAAMGATVAALAVAAWTQAGYWRDNVTLYSRSLAITGENPLVLNNLCLAFTELGQNERAISCYREVLRINPDDAEAWNNLGNAYHGLGQDQQAVGYYREALRLKPDYAKAWNNLGLACYGLARYRESIGYYGEALRIKPDMAEAWSNLGNVYHGLGQSEQAIGYYREAVRIKPDLSMAWYNLGVVYRNLGQYQEAIGCYREALRIKPDNAEAWNNLAVAFDRIGQSRQAIDCYREALRIKPDLAAAWYNLGLVYGNLGQDQQAIGCYREALRIDPDNAEAKKNLSAASAGIMRSR